MELAESIYIKKIKKLFPILLILSSNACTLINTDDSINLGGMYRYIQEYPQCIIYQTSEEHPGTGANVVGPVVRAYNFNERYIIARSQEEIRIRSDSLAKTPINYWIIDKDKPFEYGSYQPMDSVSFYRRLKDLKIALSFKQQ